MTIWLKTVWSIVGKPVHDYPGRVMTVTLRNNVDKTDTTFCNVYLPTAQSYSKEHKHEVGSAVVASATMHKEGGAFYACGDFNGPPKHMVKGAVDENTRTVMRLTEELSMKRLHNDLPTYFYTPAKSKASKMATDWEVAKEMAAKAVSVKAAAPGKKTAVSAIIGRTVLIPCTLIDHTYGGDKMDCMLVEVKMAREEDDEGKSLPKEEVMLTVEPLLDSVPPNCNLEELEVAWGDLYSARYEAVRVMVKGWNAGKAAALRASEVNEDNTYVEI